MRRGLQYAYSIIGTPYGWWTSGNVPDEEPAWAYNAPPPDPEYVKARSCFCAGVTNLMRRAEGWEIPTEGNPLYDVGTVAYRSYFDDYGVLEWFNLDQALEYGEGTLVGRAYRDVRDQGHVAVVLADGRLLQSFDTGGGWPGVNTNYWLTDSHNGYYYEWMVHPSNWLPVDGDGDEISGGGAKADDFYEYWKGECWTWLMAEGRVWPHLPGQEYDTNVDWTMQHWVHYKEDGTVEHHPPTA